MSLRGTYTFHLLQIINVSNLVASQIGSTVMYSCTRTNRIPYKAGNTPVDAAVIFFTLKDGDKRRK